MDHLGRLTSQIRLLILLAMLITVVKAGAMAWLVGGPLGQSPAVAAVVASVAALGMAVAAAFYLSRLALEPLKYLWEAILHISPAHYGTAPPNLDNARIGRELVTSLVLQVYQLASQPDRPVDSEHPGTTGQAAQVVNHLPLPLIVVDKQRIVTNANEAALKYCQLSSAQLLNRPLFECLNLEFSSDNTLEEWVEACQRDKVTAQATWEKVRVQLPAGAGIRQCDMVAGYNRDNPAGAEFIIALFDRSQQYDEDDRSFSLVALAVHELRTPLTVLRGYIEVFQEELAGTLTAELADYLAKMDASTKQLNAFINNILNVARVEENQLTLRLGEENWGSLLRQASRDIELLARARGISLQYDIAAGLPTVAVDRVSICEVMNNLLDNAIKYSGEAKKIQIIARVGRDGSVETLVRDFGIGIPASALPTLFEKFHRGHRSSARVAGTGLGLYLSRAIIKAHGGQIWVESTEGKGSTFGFSLLPYAQVAGKGKDGDNNTGITRVAHGWIKNHSLYRR